MPRPVSLNSDAEADAFLRARPKCWVLWVALNDGRISQEQFVAAAGLTDDGDFNILTGAISRKVAAVADEARYARVPA